MVAAAAVFLAVLLSVNLAGLLTPSREGLRLAPLADVRSALSGGASVAPAVAPVAPSSAGPGANEVLATADLSNRSVIGGAFAETNNGPGPSASAYDPVHQEAYVLTDSDRMLVINETTHTLATSIVVGSGSTSLVYAPDAGEMVLANPFGNNITIVDDARHSIAATLSLEPTLANGLANGTAPDALTYDPVSGKVLVGEIGLSGCCSAPVPVVDPINRSLPPPLSALPEFVALAVDPRSETLYGLNASGGNVTVYDIATHSLRATWHVPFPTGYAPTDLVLDPTDNELFVVGTSYSHWLFLSVLSLSSGAQTHSFITYSATARFAAATLAFSPTTGRVFLSAGSAQLFQLSASSPALPVGTDLGQCLGPVTLSLSGAPLLVTDGCLDTIDWLDGSTGALTESTPVGATPAVAVQVPTTGTIAVADPAAARVTYLDGASLAYLGETDLATQRPLLLTSDPTTGWVYSMDRSAGGDNVTALDPATSAVMWSWPDCAGCEVLGLGDANGSLLVSSLNAGATAQDLDRLTATNGSLTAATVVAAGWSSNVSLSGVFPSPIAYDALDSVAVVGAALAQATVGVNLGDGSVAWVRPTGSQAHGISAIPGTPEVLLATGNLTGSLATVNGASGWLDREVPLPTAPSALATGGNGSSAFAIENGSVVQVNLSTGEGELVGYPGLDIPASLAEMSAGGGVVAVSTDLGGLYWIGTPVTVTGFGPSGVAQQGLPLTLQVNVTGGYGVYHYAYGGLPTGCVSSDTNPLLCLPLSAGATQAGVAVTDSTPDGEGFGVATFFLKPFPLTATIVTLAGAAQRGSTLSLAAVLAPNESEFSASIGWLWSVSPATAGTFSTTNASATEINLTGSGPVSIRVTLTLGATQATVYDNVTVATGSGAPAPLATYLPWIVLGLGAAAVATVVALLLRRRPKAPEPERPVTFESWNDPVGPPNEASGSSPLTDPPA